MLKFLTVLSITAILAFVGGLFLPWWAIAIAAFFSALLIPLRPWVNFIAAFLALFILWGGLAWFINMQNHAVLASKISMILPLGGSAAALVFITALVAALVAGVSALSGRYFYGLIRPAN